MKPKSADIQRAAGALAGAEHILVVSHERPDGDAVGSILGLSLSLRQLGKRSTCVLADGLPGRFRFLPAASSIRRRPEPDFDLLVSLDSSSNDRFGIPAADFGRPFDLNIDHHPTNTCFARINLVDDQAASTASLLFDLAPALGLPIDQETASCWLTGLVTDTLGFRTSNVTPAVLRRAADLVDLGASVKEIFENALVAHTFPSLRYWGAGLSRLERQDGLVWASLRLADRQVAGYPGRDDADLIDLINTIEDAQIVVLFIEQDQQATKVSWRTRADFDLSQLAARFGGGGHRPAAGATIAGSFQDIQQAVLLETRRLLAGIPNEAI
jgi:bifunctional oligoribonuclease and PAP phosphatase NrnA